MAVGLILAGAAVVGGISSAIGGKKAADKKKQIARYQAQLTFTGRMEEIRRAQKNVAEIEGLAVATGYSSGIQHSGSTKRYVDSLRSEHGRQIQFAKMRANQEKDLIRKGGSTPGQSQAMLGTAASTLASAVSGYNSVK